MADNKQRKLERGPLPLSDEERAERRKKYQEELHRRLNAPGNEHLLAERRARKKLANQKQRERLYAPGNEDLLAHRRAKRRDAKRKMSPAERERDAAARDERLRESARQRAIFTQNVPPVLGSRNKTRLFISVCEHGPLNGHDITQSVMAARGGPRDVAINALVSLGVLAVHRPGKKALTVYYLNPGHPAYRELLAFGRALARRWPPPPRPTRLIEETPISVAQGDAPCTLFGNEERNRILLLISVAGEMPAVEVFRDAGLMSHPETANRALKHLVRLGLLARAPVPFGKGAGKGQARPYFLNTEFFAYQELRRLLFVLAATLHDDVSGIARALSRTNSRISAHFKRFEREVADRLGG